MVELLGDISGFTSSLKDADKQTQSWASGLGGKVANLAGGVVVGAAAAGAAAVASIGVAAFNVSNDVATASADMAASLGIPIEEAENFADVARRVYGNNFADSVDDAADAVTNVAKTMRLAADDPALKTMTENAFRLRDSFDVDVNESVSAAQTLMENFGISGEEAFDLLAKGYQGNLDRSGDFLDTIGEYSTQFASGGASAQEFFGLLDSGLQGGMLGTDKAADAFKEFRVRIADGSKGTADSLAAIGLSAEDITARMSAGTLTAAGAWNEVMTALQMTQDPVVQMQAGVGLLGTQFEDLGTDAALALDLTADWAEGSEGAISSLDAKYNTFGSAVEGIWRRLIVSISPYTDKILELVNDAMPQVMAAFDAFDQNVGPIMESAQRTIDTVVNYVKNLFGGFKRSADTELTAPLEYWRGWLDQNMPRIRQIIETVLDAIQTFWAAWGDEIMAVVNFVFGTIGTIVNTAMQNIGDAITLILQILTGDWEGAWNTLQGIVQRTWDMIASIIGTALDGIWTKIQEIDWGEVGRNIIEGIADGISGAVGKIADAARDAAQSAYEAAKSWLGISSPSTRFEYLGEQSAAGYSGALDDSLQAATRRIGDSLGALMGGLSVDVMQPAPAMVAAGSGQPINITIYADSRDAARQAQTGVLAGLRQAGLA